MWKILIELVLCYTFPFFFAIILIFKGGCTIISKFKR
jgi:hypothetical protein